MLTSQITIMSPFTGEPGICYVIRKWGPFCTGTFRTRITAPMETSIRPQLGGLSQITREVSLL